MSREVTRKQFLTTVGGMLAAAPLLRCGPIAASTSRPNVVMIMADTLRADVLGCYGFPENTSPELDRIAEASVQFDSVAASCPWTLPSVASFLTSQHPRCLGLHDLNFRGITWRRREYCEHDEQQNYYNRHNNS